MFAISTMTQFIALIIFALSLNLWNLNSVLLIMFAFICLLYYQNNQHFLRLMKRLKWFYLVMFLIFLFNTPGEHMVSWEYSFKPTYEGLQLGVKQILRIALMLAAISLILVRNTSQQLISGLYCLMKPLSCVGLDIKRFAVRLWLTLHYVELASAAKPTATMSSLGEQLEDVFADEDAQHTEVTLERAVLTWLDYLVIFMMLIILAIAFKFRG